MGQLSAIQEKNYVLLNESSVLFSTASDGQKGKQERKLTG
jgi:hypothetical protein